MINIYLNNFNLQQL